MRSDGPLDWRSYGTITSGATWAAASRRVEDDGMINLATSEPIVLDSVRLAPQDPALFAPIRLLGAWLTDGAVNQTVRAGRWPEPLSPLHCTVVQAIKDPKAQPILLIRIKVPIGQAANGRKWSANRGVLVRYHTLDGTPYAAMFGYVVVFPTSPSSHADEGVELLTHPASSPATPASSQS